MSLFIDVSGGFPLDAESDTAQTANGDAGSVSDIPVSGDSTAVQITYTQTQSGFAQDRLNDLVNNLSCTIVVGGVDSSFVINGAPISNNAGVTFVDGGGIVRIIYDVTQCGGTNYFVFDTGGNQIAFPNPVLLGHELAHAFHTCVGDSPPLGDPAAEVQAETDENSYRTQFGLPLRDANNHGGGCGLNPNGGSPWTISCLIASAAHGTPHSPQLNNVRRLRDTILRRSAWGAEFFDQLHEEYYRFSPQVAVRMNRSEDVRQTISLLIVEPFFELMAILEIYAKLGADCAPLAQARVHRFRTELLQAGGTSALAAAVLTVLVLLKGRLHADTWAEREYDVIFEPRAGASAIEILAILCDVIEAAVPAGGYASWALLDPIILFWNAVCRAEQSGAEMLCEIDQWLYSAPLPSCYAMLDVQDIVDDLKYLRQILFTSQAVREALGGRLTETYGSAFLCDWRRLLEESGYTVVEITR